MSTVALLILTCAVLACIPVVTSDESDDGPVIPVIDLRHPLMRPGDACLFICQMCFFDNVRMLMSCINTACSNTKCNVVDLVYIGRTCNHPGLLDKYIFPTKNLDPISQQESNVQETPYQ